MFVPVRTGEAPVSRLSRERGLAKSAPRWAAHGPHRLVLAALLGALLAPPVALAADGPPVPLSPASPLSLPLTFATALQRAISEAPQLAAQRFAVSAAQAAVGPAGQLPDPKLALGIDNLPVDGADRFSLSRDFMTMRRIGVMQDFPREEKRRLRGERAEAEADKERATLAALFATAERETALAWLDAYFAEAQGQTLAELVPEAELVSAVAKALLAGGKTGAADPLAARSAEVALQDRIAEAERNRKRSRALLVRWVGSADAARPLGPLPDLTALAHGPEALLAELDRHPELAPLDAQTAMARAEAALARLATQPDWSLEVAYQQRGPAFSNMLSVAVRFDLPLWGATRQDPLAVAREQQLAQVQASRDEARRRHEAEIRSELAAWEAALDRVDRLAKQALPLARERTVATLAAYRGGRGDLNAVLQARGNEIETRLALIQQQAELGRAWASLNFLFGTHAAGGRP